MRRNMLTIGIILLALGACQKGELNSATPLQKDSLEEVIEIKEHETASFKFVKEDNLIKTENDASRITDLKIIKTGKVRYEVSDIIKSTKDIKEVVLASNGYVSGMHFDNNSYKKENTFTVKVPNYQFDDLMQKIRVVAKDIIFENITTQDVTEAFIDATSRLKTKMEVKKRYEEILRKRAHKVEDLLKVEEQINDIQEEIEAVQGKLNYMKNKVALSSIQIELYEEVTLEIPEDEGDSFSGEIKEGMQYGLNILKAILLFIIHLWPLLIVLLLVLMWVRKRRKK